MTTPRNAKTFSHYFKDVRHLSHVDVYRVLSLFGVTDPCLQHAIKKLLVAGGRGLKDQKADLLEAIASIERAIEMQIEDIDTHCSECGSGPCKGLPHCRFLLPKMPALGPDRHRAKGKVACEQFSAPSQRYQRKK